MSRPKAKLHEVPIVATKDDSGIRFTPRSDLWDDPSGSLHFHKDHHGLRKADYHLAEFVLDDRSGEGLKFPRVPHDAMWVAAAQAGEAKCPDKNSVSNYEVLEPISVSDDGKRLIVRNDNPRSERWGFTLNFTKRGADEADVDSYVSWDPIIDNHNGGS